MGFVTFDIKSELWVFLSEIIMRNGLLKFTFKGFIIRNFDTIPIPMAAAASVPDSATSSTALWTTCGERHHSLETMEGSRGDSWSKHRLLASDTAELVCSCHELYPWGFQFSA